MTVEAFFDVVHREVQRVVVVAAGRLEREVAMAVAYTPVEFRHRITIVSQDGISTRHVACLLPA